MKEEDNKIMSPAYFLSFLKMGAMGYHSLILLTNFQTNL